VLQSYRCELSASPATSILHLISEDPIDRKRGPTTASSIGSASNRLNSQAIGRTVQFLLFPGPLLSVNMSHTYDPNSLFKFSTLRGLAPIRYWEEPCITLK
jgi:hypothetical protein